MNGLSDSSDQSPILKDDGTLPSDRYGMPKTDHTRWRYYTDEYGKNSWVYRRETDHLTRFPPSAFTLHTLELPSLKTPKLSKPETPFQAAYNSYSFLTSLQDECGTFPCQYGGPMFMIIAYVVAKYFTGVPFSDEERIEICRYLVNRAHPVDGGWGLHTIDKSTVFGTTINYVVLRILGMEKEHPALVKARRLLKSLGGAIGCPLWGKAYLAILNLYDWRGVNPSPPELWSLPYWIPLHPGRWWVHTRAIFLSLSYLYSNKVCKPLNPLLEQLRQEIYVKPYESIDFSKHRNTVNQVDLYYPHSKVLDITNNLLVLWDKYQPSWLRKRFNSYAAELVFKDLQNNDHLSIAPLSCALNSIVVFIEKGKQSMEFERLVFRWPDTLFMTPEGMMVCGTNGVQVWDVSFALQYAVYSGLAGCPEFKDSIIKGYRFLCRSQFTDNCVEGSFRDPRKGAFPFSTKIQGYTVSDTTSEAMKALIMIQNYPGFEFLKEEFPPERFYEAVDILLSLHNKSTYHYGSFASYEQIKGSEILEKLNPAECFANIMVEYPYVECTDSSVLGLVSFREHFDYRAEEIDETISTAIDYIISYQQKDGSWYGSWGVCFTYATMFALEALSTQGYTYENSETVRNGCNFLISKQEEDGGWAESFRSCEIHTYVRHVKSEVVQSSWALLALLSSQYPDEKPLQRSARFLMNKQNPDGSYSYNHMEGVFNHSCAIEYPNYKYYFPAKALGLYAKRFGKNAKV